MNLLALLMAAAIATPANSAPAIWEKYPKLNCRGDTVYFCELAGSKACRADRANAVFAFDFSSNAFRSFVDDKSEKIVAKIHKVSPSPRSPDHNSVVLELGELITLFLVKPDSDGNPTIAGVKQGAMIGQAETMVLTCHPA